MPCRDGMKRLVGIKRLEKLDEAFRRKRAAGTDWSKNGQKQGPQKEGEKKLTAAGKSQGEEERDRGQQEKEKYTSETHGIVQQQSTSGVRENSSRSLQGQGRGDRGQSEVELSDSKN